MVRFRVTSDGKEVVLTIESFGVTIFVREKDFEKLKKAVKKFEAYLNSRK